MCCVVIERPLPPPFANDDSHTTTTNGVVPSTPAVVSPTVTQSVTDTATVVPVTTSTVTTVTVTADVTATVIMPITISDGHTISTSYNAMPTSFTTDKGMAQFCLYVVYTMVFTSTAPHGHASNSVAVIAVIAGLVSGCIVVFGVLAIVYYKRKKKLKLSKKYVHDLKGKITFVQVILYHRLSL